MLGMKKEEYRETFSAEPGTVLKVYNKTGSVDVSSWDRDYVEVEAIKKSISDKLVPLNEARIEVTPGNEFVVRTHYDTFRSRGVSVDYRITVPKGVLVTHLETATGKINVADVSGDVDAKASTGAIQIHKVNGFIKAVTSTGSINVDNVSGDVDAKASTGAIKIQRVDGFVRAVASTGSIDITGVGGIYEARTSTGKISAEVQAIRDSLEIRSSMGGITVFLSPSIAAQLEVNTSNGSITYEDLPLTVSQSSKTRLIGRLGEGGGKIDIKTSTGSIHLKKLP